ncbi:MAG: hypothetical protein M3R70_01530 [Actinomycetota bacterium]|nr:hypothetical protein [Actinomycetota bacterium]
MLKRTVPLLALLALALPVAAGAKLLDIKGPVALLGHGGLRGELSSEAGARPVRLRIQAGVFRVTDLAGDLKARCLGRVRSGSKQDADGHTVWICSAKRGLAVISGSNYHIGGLARRYTALIPAGVSGTLGGRFNICAVGEDGELNCRRDAQQPGAQPVPESGR